MRVLPSWERSRIRSALPKLQAIEKFSGCTAAEGAAVLKDYLPAAKIRKHNIRRIIMKITICIGSSCHLKGSRQIVEQLQYLVAENNLKDKVELSGTFCMGNCVNGVNVTVDDKLYSLSPETTKDFLKKKSFPK